MWADSIVAVGMRVIVDGIVAVAIIAIASIVDGIVATMVLDRYRGTFVVIQNPTCMKTTCHPRNIRKAIPVARQHLGAAQHSTGDPVERQSGEDEAALLVTQSSWMID